MTETTHATEVVENMLHALRDRNVDDAVALFDDRIVWHNVGLPKVRGRDRVGKFMEALAKPEWGFDVTIHNIAANGNIVLTERTDAIVYRRLRVEFWVCGTFELRDGKIAVWRDYGDPTNILKGFTKGAFRALVMLL
ncbi:limonene-1,2-epoxide hydrolase family protein [Rhodococcoides kyotonense]|uniref:Limonene-1,2-epoxide hydrolase n=1 Tax=Rhodococcoides kyotonense TaxID=398843 RepID=A0A239IAL4_9NOCA|nr:limonene-1,2-epoxide hydrolase family protein [Rhodococcus kyotonensis]SNS90579.1 limonene-1,2-epoxide hydrolase [Rhodococcus kyotonensis]